MSTRLYRPGEDLLTREIPDYTESGFHRELGSVRSRGRRKEGGREVADLWGPAVGEPRGRRGACLPGPIGPCEWAGEREKAGGGSLPLFFYSFSFLFSFSSLLLCFLKSF